MGFKHAVIAALLSTGNTGSQHIEISDVEPFPGAQAVQFFTGDSDETFPGLVVQLHGRINGGEDLVPVVEMASPQWAAGLGAGVAAYRSGATTPSSVWAGATRIFLGLQGTTDEHNVVGAWTTYTSNIFANGGGLVLGAGGYLDGSFKRMGKTVWGQAAIGFGVAGMAPGAGTYRVQLPVVPPVSAHNIVLGQGFVYDSSTNSLWTVVVDNQSGVNGWGRLLFTGAAGAFVVGAAAPFAFGTSDQVSISFLYEAA